MERDHDATDGLVYSPLPEDECSYTELGSFTVDGEIFLVRRRNEDGSHHYDWVSGPNDGYGFSVSGGSEPISRERHEIAIRDFLRSINPATGYL